MSSSAGGLVPSVELDEEVVAPQRAWRAVVDSAQGRIGLAAGVLMLGLILVGRFFAPHDPMEIGAGVPSAGASRDHLLGTDQLGRDVLSRLLSGGDAIVLVPFLAVLLAYLVGGGLGLFAAYRGGRLDVLITRSFDVILTLPPLLVVLVIIAGLGSSKAVLVATIALVYVPRVGRLIRGAAQGIVTNDYIAAAQARGERTSVILVREIFPNIVAPAAADFALRITYAVIFVATLNFLGLGARPPASDWGLMVAESRSFISSAPLATVAPAACIALLSISLNLIADALTRHVRRRSVGGIVPL